MSLVREILLLFLSGIILWLAFFLGNTVAVMIVTVLPLGMFGELGSWLGLFLLILILGFVGRFVLKFLPH